MKLLKDIRNHILELHGRLAPNLSSVALMGQSDSHELLIGLGGRVMNDNDKFSILSILSLVDRAFKYSIILSSRAHF